MHRRFINSVSTVCKHCPLPNEATAIMLWLLGDLIDICDAASRQVPWYLLSDIIPFNIFPA